MTWEQTAEVLAREVYRLQKENDRLKEFVHEVAHVNVADFSDGWKALVEFARVGRCLLSSAAEGGGAANGGESKIPTCPLCEKKMVARKVFNSEDNLNWVMGVCDSCSAYSPPLYSIDPQKALDTAILGLHTLAGEFPTAMFETRKDYLKATISEINEILGKQ